MKLQTIALLLLVAAPALAVGPPVPKEFVGDWAANDAACASGPKLHVEASSVALVNGSDTQKFGGIDLCYSCEGGAQYSGKVVWLLPEFGSGKTSPFTVYFNADEAVGTTKVEMRNDDVKKKFPLHMLKLKKCAAKK